MRSQVNIYEVTGNVRSFDSDCVILIWSNLLFIMLRVKSGDRSVGKIHRQEMRHGWNESLVLALRTTCGWVPTMEVRLTKKKKLRFTCGELEELLLIVCLSRINPGQCVLHERVYHTFVFYCIEETMYVRVLPWRTIYVCFVYQQTMLYTPGSLRKLVISLDCLSLSDSW